jgi:hypothetical protein
MIKTCAKLKLRFGIASPLHQIDTLNGSGWIYAGCGLPRRIRQLSARLTAVELQPSLNQRADFFA